jgi:hypothetical protein
MLSRYKFDVVVGNTDLMRGTDVRLTASFDQNALEVRLAQYWCDGRVSHSSGAMTIRAPGILFDLAPSY